MQPPVRWLVAIPKPPGPWATAGLKATACSQCRWLRKPEVCAPYRVSLEGTTHAHLCSSGSSGSRDTPMPTSPHSDPLVFGKTPFLMLEMVVS